MPAKAKSQDDINESADPNDPTSTSNDTEVQAIDLPINDGSPAAKADVTHAHIVADPQADVLAWDPKAPTGDLTVPRADSHDPRPAS